MTYATQADLEARLAPELLMLAADDDGDGAADAAVIQAVLDDASARINQALARRYVTPVDPASDILTRWCADLAVESLLLRRREALPREFAERADLARRALDAIATGRAALAGAQARLDAFDSDNTRRDHDPIFSDEQLDLY